MELVEIAGAGGDDLVAVACVVDQAPSVEDGDEPPLITDKPSGLKGDRRVGDAGAGGADHKGDELLCEFEYIVAVAIVAHKQPTGEAFVEVVKPVADRGLADLHHIAIDRVEHEALKITPSVELGQYLSYGQTVGRPCTLHYK